MPDATPFHLSVAPALVAFRPELEHACRFVAAAHGLTFTSGDGVALHYGDNPPAGAVANPARILPAGTTLRADGIHPDRAKLQNLFSDSGLTGPLIDDVADVATETDSVPYDALGMIFLMISRVEERSPDTTDRHGRFRYADSVFPHLGGPAIPWADVAARRLAGAILKTGNPPCAGSYRIVLTHDVDRLKGHHTISAALREVAGDAVKRMNPARAARTFARSFLGGDPWSSMDDIMTWAEAKNLTSKFFFIGPSRDPKDSPYAATMPDLLRTCADRIRARGHGIGFHPGYATFDDAETWVAQKRGLESVLGATLTEGRQHVLRYDIARTPVIWEHAGMETDYTLCFPEAAGFRTGSCRDVAAYDLVGRESMSLRYVATAITDFGLLGKEYEGRSPDDAIAHCKSIAAQVRTFAGNLCILYHSGNRDPIQRSFYRALMDTV
ncbi:MAG: hypothetical protein RIC16_16630 [Rhodospirillales bacterium]